MSNEVTAVESVVKRGPGRPKTKVTLKRTVLLNGIPVGKGRPSTEGKSERMVVYIPVGEKYNAEKHGIGCKFVPGLNQFGLSIKRMDIKKWEKLAHTVV